MAFESDLAVFYGPPFGVWCALRRPDAADVPFQALKGSVDEVVLSGYAVAADYSLRYPTASVDLDEGDTVLVEIGTKPGPDGKPVPAMIFGEVQGGAVYRVRAEPRAVNDGAETQAPISLVRSQ